MATAWDPNKKNPNFEIVSARRARNNISGGWYGGLTTDAKAATDTKEYYFEWAAVSSASQNACIIGFTTAASTLSDYPGSDATSIGLWDNGGQWLGGSGGSSIGSIVPGDIVGFAFKPSTKSVRARRNGGAWSTARTFTFDGPYYVIGSFNTGPAEFVMAWASADMANAVPAGMTAWDAAAANTSINGTAAITLGGIIAASAGSLPIKGLSSNALGSVLASSTGRLPIRAVSAVALSQIVAAGAGGAIVTGAAPLTLGPIGTGASSAVVIAGSATVALDAIGTASTAQTRIAGASSLVLAGIGAGSTAANLIRGFASSTLDPVQLTASSNSVAVSIGSLAVTLGQVTTTAAGSAPVRAVANLALGEVGASGIGAALSQGQASVQLGTVAVAASASMQVRAAVTIALQAISSGSAGQLRISAVIAMELGSIALASAGTEPNALTDSGLVSRTFAGRITTVFRGPTREATFR